jgi:hypothetical protein
MLFFICDFCKNRAQQIIKVPCLTYSYEDGGFTFAKIIDSEAAVMNICAKCFGVENK